MRDRQCNRYSSCRWRLRRFISLNRGNSALQQPIRFLAADRILPHTHSPLQDKYPNAEVDVPLRELLELAVTQSDNAAADVVLRVIGGPTVVETYIRSLGVTGFQLKDGEDALARDAKRNTETG